jgi:hypothetical protein
MVALRVDIGTFDDALFRQIGGIDGIGGCQRSMAGSDRIRWSSRMAGCVGQSRLRWRTLTLAQRNALGLHCKKESTL